MADYSAPRDTVRDFRFLTRDQEGGSQVDQYNWTDGLTHNQWPTVQFWTGPNATGTDITSQFVKNITADTISSATHKDPTGTSGVWRGAQGEYYVRVKPNPALAYATYYMHVSFAPTATQTRVEDLTAEITTAGDIDPNAPITPADVKVGFSTTLDDTVIEGIIEEATEAVYGEMEAVGIDPDALILSNGGLTRGMRQLILLKARCMIGGYDLSTGTKVRSIREGSEQITFATSAKDTFGMDPCTAYATLLKAWLKRNSPGRKPMLGNVTRKVGHVVNEPQGSSSDSDADWV